MHKIYKNYHIGFLCHDLSEWQYPLCTLLVFDSRQHALPIAWVIIRNIAKPDMSKWMKALLDCAHAIDPGWKINGFLIDDATEEINLTRHDDLTQYFLFKFIYNANAAHSHRIHFPVLFYFPCGVFKDHSCEMLSKGVVTLKNVAYNNDRALSLASQEASGAIEAYHMKLKVKLYDDLHIGALQRVDWLMHKLITELHSSYWLDRLQMKEEYIASNSWHRALQIPDSSIILNDKNHLFAKVVSQKDSSSTHLVWNLGSEFVFCDCSWSVQGNLCKHML
ncbi:hypothetical protein HYC85_001520 [Camellia sinensis]|uniref:SWIM-type domain-containing protein n=1 Tax=Camellia sinensis TaxID=4442 RepID=A0A7J7I6Y4_CAMSI|nr:hypothetical protein HYC85_001520 [Camellia sinensis]